MRHEQFHSIEPEQALRTYLQHRKNKVSKATNKAHRYRLQHFIRYCDLNDIEDLSELTGQTMQNFRFWRQQEGDLSIASVHTQMSTLRVFVRWLESYDVLPEGFRHRVRMPDMNKSDNVSEAIIEPDRAFDLLEYLGQYEYASSYHALFSLLWFTGVRIGAARGIDLGDIGRDEQGAYLDLHHRPDQGTPLKNKKEGERMIALHDKRYRIVQDFIQARRVNATDDYGREPLFATEHGRAHTTTLRDWVYKMSHPCYDGSDCPHGREMDSCKALKDNGASDCPSAINPHAVRRGSITYWLSEDVNKDAVSERMNVHDEALDLHYDKRTESEKMNQRRDKFF